MAATGMTGTQTKATHKVNPAQVHAAQQAVAHQSTVHAPTGYPSNAYRPAPKPVVHPTKHKATAPPRRGSTVTPQAVAAAQRLLHQNGHHTMADSHPLAAIIPFLKMVTPDVSETGPFSGLYGDTDPLSLLARRLGLNPEGGMHLSDRLPHGLPQQHGSAQSLQNYGHTAVAHPMETSDLSDSPAARAARWIEEQRRRAAGLAQAGGYIHP